MRKVLPRDVGGSFEVKEGTGNLRASISTGDMLEFYKQDKTFRLYTPETLDPERTDPNMPFAVSPVQDVGTSNRIVARVLLQSDRVLDLWFATQEQKFVVRKNLHECKELLLRCEKIANGLERKIDAVEQSLKASGVPLENGRVLNPFPQVEDLESDCTAFLNQASRAIKLISGLPSLFISMRRADKNFDYLGKHLAEQIGADAPLTKFVQYSASGVQRVISMRDGVEHPDGVALVVNNCMALPNRVVRAPTWHLENATPEFVKEDVAACLDFLICICEEMIIHLVMHCGRDQLVFGVREIPTSEVDDDFPVKYRVEAFPKDLRFSNPLHKDDGKSGTNPLYEKKE